VEELIFGDGVDGGDGTIFSSGADEESLVFFSFDDLRLEDISRKALSGPRNRTTIWPVLGDVVSISESFTCNFGSRSANLFFICTSVSSFLFRSAVYRSFNFGKE